MHYNKKSIKQKKERAELYANVTNRNIRFGMWKVVCRFVINNI